MAYRPELLSPAGTLQSMRFAYAYGADAVYAGQPRYSLRVRNNEFTLDKLGLGIEQAHTQGKKLYVVSNIAPHNAKVKSFIDDMTPVIDLQPDALIMSDPGLIMLVREKWPDMDIHLSVQANAVNWASVKFWQSMGLTRTILSRELTLEEIAEIRQMVPDMELEVFVHGALCIAYSGRCLLSGYMNHRDPNQGTCTNACRWNYAAHEAQETPEGRVEIKAEDITFQGQGATLGEGQPTDKIFMLEEAQRPGEYMPAFEDEHGTYIMNSKDLRAIEHVPKLIEMGIHSLKIEGRTKSHYYVARTAQTYRKAMDDALAGRPFDPHNILDLDSLANRGYTEGFYRRHTHDATQNYQYGSSKNERQQFVAEVIEGNQAWLHLSVKNKFMVGDELEVMTPRGNRTFVLQAMEDLQGNAKPVAPGSGHEVRIPNPISDIPEADYPYVLITRFLHEPIYS